MCTQFFIHEGVQYRTDQNQSRNCYLNNDGPVQFVGIAAVDVLCVCVCVCVCVRVRVCVCVCGEKEKVINYKKVPT